MTVQKNTQKKKASATKAAAGNVATTSATGEANLAPATTVDASGSPQQIVPDVNLNHPAVDNDPRKDTTVSQNRIDFNDQTISGQEAVERNLGMK